MIFNSLSIKVLESICLLLDFILLFLGLDYIKQLCIIDYSKCIIELTSK